MTNEKYFPKTISQWEFDYGLFTNLPRIIIPHDFSRVHSNSKEVSYLSWQNTYPNLKTTGHIKLKFFLRTKLLENLLLAKYLVSATAPLSNRFNLYLWRRHWIHEWFLSPLPWILWSKGNPLWQHSKHW